MHGLCTWPDRQNSLVPVLFGRPMLANQLDPRPFGPPRVHGDLGRVVAAGIVHDDNLHAVGGVVDREEAVER